jgi:hypothetical protein
MMMENEKKYDGGDTAAAAPNSTAQQHGKEVITICTEMM